MIWESKILRRVNLLPDSRSRLLIIKYLILEFPKHAISNKIVTNSILGPIYGCDEAAYGAFRSNCWLLLQALLTFSSKINLNIGFFEYIGSILWIKLNVYRLAASLSYNIPLSLPRISNHCASQFETFLRFQPKAVDYFTIQCTFLLVLALWVSK